MYSDETERRSEREKNSFAESDTIVDLQGTDDKLLQKLKYPENFYKRIYTGNVNERSQKGRSEWNPCFECHSHSPLQTDF